MVSVNTQELMMKVKSMYRQVAENPKSQYHFEMGRALAEKLGYPAQELDKIPKEAVESFAGVGYYFDLALLNESYHVLDLGSGSGMDSFLAALRVGKGKVIGVDMTPEQLKKAEELRKRDGFLNVSFVEGYIENLPFQDSEFDVVVSNGVINLSAEKEKVFVEISRVLKKGGRLVIADIVSEKQLTENITCDAAIWASCIGGAMQQDAYKKAIESTGLKILSVKENPQYQFLSKSAQGASRDFGVKSISILAEKQ